MNPDKRGADKVQTIDKERILLIDDEASIIEITRDVLERHGYSVFVASYGYEAIALYRETIPPFDLVILDVNLPDMSGEDVLARLLDINPHIRVILSSGYCLTEKTNDMKGVCQFLQKPFRIAELVKKVHDALEKK